MNLLFVFSDQQRYTALGANCNRVVQTPHLDRMAAEGMVCDNMFSNHPLCSPLRAILLTGRYGWRNGVIDNEYEPFRDIPTLPGALRSAGYHTGHVGVWHLGVGQYPDEYRLYDPADVDLPGNVPPQMADFARREIADYYGCCTGLDAQMGRLLDALERLGLADDTTVEEMETRLHRWMEGTGDPFEFGRRGPRGFIDIGQRWTDPVRWKDWGTA